MEWLPIVAVIAPVVASLGTLLVTQRHADKAAERQGVTDRERWEFEARERRFDDRFAAVTAFDELAERTHLATWEWYHNNPEYKQPEPFKGPPGVPKELGARVARVVLHASQRAARPSLRGPSPGGGGNEAATGFPRIDPTNDVTNDELH